MARARRTGKMVLLTNAHVVAGCDPPATAIGRRIGQPDDDSDYTCCSKCWATVVGTVIAAKSDPLHPKIDVAIIQLDKCVDPSPQVEGIGPIHGVLTTNELNAMALSHATVFVRGFRTAEVRQGIVQQADHDGFIACSSPDPASSGIHNFENVMRLETAPTSSGPFSQRGDSGSVVLDSNNKVVGLLFGHGPVQGVPSFFVCRIDNILAEFQADLDLEILTNPGFEHAASPEPGAAFSMAPAPVTGEGFEPTSEDLRLLERARDEVLGTALGQRLMQLVSKHVQEVRTLIKTRQRVAAAWQRVAAPDLLQALVDSLKSPETSFSKLVIGPPLVDRSASLVRVLTRYGSESLVEDLNRLLPIATRWTDASYAELLAWLKTAPAEEI